MLALQTGVVATPLSPAQASQVPTPGAARRQKGKKAVGQGRVPAWPKLALQLCMHLSEVPERSQPGGTCKQCVTSAAVHSPHTCLVVSQTGPSVDKVQSALLLQQADSGTGLVSEAKNCSTSCLDCEPPVEPEKPM